MGKTVEVLVAEKNDGVCFGKAENDAAISFRSDGSNVGDFVKVKITASKNANLTGEVCDG